MSVPPAVLDRMTDTWRGPEDEIGERVTRAFLDLWEDDPEAGPPRTWHVTPVARVPISVGMRSKLGYARRPTGM